MKRCIFLLFIVFLLSGCGRQLPKSSNENTIRNNFLDEKILLLEKKIGIHLPENTEIKQFVLSKPKSQFGFLLEAQISVERKQEYLFDVYEDLKVYEKKFANFLNNSDIKKKKFCYEIFIPRTAIFDNIAVQSSTYLYVAETKNRKIDVYISSDYIDKDEIPVDLYNRLLKGAN